MAVLLTEPVLQFLDANGNPLSGGLIYTYIAGTNTPKATFTDSSESTANANPVVLDAAGKAPIWINGSYKIVVRTSLGVLVSTTDNITSFNTSSTSIDQILPNQTGNGGKFLTTNGTNASWGAPSVIPVSSFIDKVLFGLKLSNNTIDAANDIDIAAGSCVSDDGTTVMVLSAITKRLDAVWVVGTGQGGLDTGTIANGTYHVWVINRTDTNTTDVLFSTSATAPTMPSPYTKKKCIGSIVRAGGSILLFDQYDNQFILRSPVLDIVDAATGTSAKTGTLSSIPTGARMEALLTAFNASNGTYAYFSSLDSTDLAPSTTAAPLAHLGTTTSNNATSLSVWTNTSAQIRYRLSSNDTLRVATLGWKDSRI